MGLDSYAYAAKEVQQHPTEPCAVIFGKEDESGEYATFNEVIDLCYWRKFNALHNWMEQLYRTKSGDDEEEFNCIKILLNQEDLDALEEVCLNKKLVPKEGFFFGSQAPIEDWQYDELKETINKAINHLKQGYHVYYDSWW